MMNGGYANIFDTSAIQEIVLAAAAADVTSTVTGAEVDREAYSDSDLLQHLAVIVLVDATIATPSGGDSIDITVEFETGPTGGPYVDLKTATLTVVTDTNTSAKVAAVLPVKLLAGERYGVGKVTVAMTGGAAGTLSAATGSMCYAIFPLDTQPSPNYNIDGYTSAILA